METGTANQTATSGRFAIEKTAASAHQTVDKIADAAVPAIDRLAATARQTVDRIAHTATPAAEWLGDSLHKVDQSGIKMMEDGKQCVRDHPLAAVGAALAIGALLGYMARTHH